MPRCPGMGLIIGGYTDEISRAALQFCFENMICPADLQRYIDFADVFCPLSEDIKDELRDLAAEAQQSDSEVRVLMGHIGKKVKAPAAATKGLRKKSKKAKKPGK